MARKSDIRLRRSAISGSVPGGADLNLGELALNTADGAIFVKNGAGNIVTVSHDGILHYDEPNSRIGIGTTVPDRPLHVNGGSTDYVARFESSDNNTGIELKDSTSTGAIRTQNGHMVYIADTGDVIGSSSHRWNIDHLSTGEKMRLNAAGELGIGTQSPQAKLDIQNATAGTAASVVAAGTSAGIYLEDDQTPTDNYFVSKVHNPGNDTAIGGIKFAVSPDASNYSWAGIKGLTSTSGNAGNLAFYTSASNSSGDSSTERMRIDGAGNVGIGVTSLVNGDKFTVNGNINLNGKLFNGTSNNSAGLDFASNYINYHGYAGHRFYAQAAGIGSMAERMRITVDGNVGIGTTLPNQKLHVNGSGRFRSAASGLGSFIAVGNQTETAGNYSAYYFGNTSNDTGYFKGGIAYETLSTTHGRGDMHFLQRSDTGGGNADISHSVMTILNSGSVGIGTTAPSDTLHISKATFPTLKLEDTGLSSNLILQTHSSSSEHRLSGTGAYPLVFKTNDIERMRIKADGLVGIGTSSPSEKLDVRDGTITSRDATNTNYAEIDRFGGLTLKGNGTGAKYITTPNTDALGFKTNNVERARIDSSGNVLVSTTNTAPATNNVAGIALRNEGHINVSRASGVVGYFNRITDDGDILRLLKDGSTVGSIGTASGTLVVGTTNGSGSYLKFGSNVVAPVDVNGTVRDSAIDLGQTNARFKDLYLSGKVNAAKAEFTSGSADHIYLNRSGHDSFRIALSHGTGLSFHNETDSRTDVMVDGSGNIIFGGVSVGAAGAMSVKVDGSYTDLYLYGEGTSQGGRIFFGDSSDRSSIVGTYGTGGGGKLSFKTDTTGGTSQDRLVIDSDGSITFNGAFTFPTAIGAAGQILKVPATGTELIWGADAGGGSATLLTDGDGDTLIQVEKNTDEDIIRFDIAGTEQLQLNSTGLVVAGNLTVNGTQTILNTATLSVDDLNITVADGAANAAAANGAGLTVDGANATLTYVSTGDKWSLNKPLDVLFAGDAGVKIESSDNHSSLFIDSHTAYGQYIRFTENNANKYWINSASGKLVFRPAGTATVSSQVVFDASGNVGIGTDSPGTKLHVNGGILTVNDGTGTTYYEGVKIHSYDTNGFDIIGREGLTLSTTSADKDIILSPTGNVGIGNTAPAEKFTIGSAAGKGDIGFHIGGHRLITFGYMTANSSATTYAGFPAEIRHDPSTGALRFGIDGTTRAVGDSSSVSTALTIKTGGNVGIGTTSPAEKLHVVGGAAAVKIESSTNEASLKYDNSTTTGVIKLANNDLKTELGGSEVMRILANGNVGIGEANPNGKLVVRGANYAANQDGGIIIQAGARDSSHWQSGFKIKSDASGNARTTIDATTGATAGTLAERISIDTAGKVGIGTSSPVATLDVNGITKLGNSSYSAGIDTITDGALVVPQGKRIVSQDSAGNNYLRTIFAHDASTNNYVFGQQGTSLIGDMVFQPGSSGNFRVFASGSEDFRINTAGNVGIGTTTPDRQLEVEGQGVLRLNATGSNTDPGIDFNTSSVNDMQIRYRGGSDKLAIFSYGTTSDVLTIQKADGNVGIGTTSPDTKLDITTSGVEGLILNQDTASAATSSRLFFKDNVRINGMLNVNGILEFRTGMVVGNTSGTKRLTVSPTLVKSEVPLRVEEYQIDTTTSSTSATTQVAIHTFVAATFRSARFTIQITNTTDSTYHSTEILAIHDGTTANITEFGEVHTGSSVEATFDADVNSGNFRLLATPASTDAMAFKVVCHSLTV